VQDLEDDGTKTKHKEDLPFNACGSEGFNFDHQAEIKLRGLNTYNCLTNRDYEIMGGPYNKEFKYLELKLWKCQNSTKSNIECKS